LDLKVESISLAALPLYQLDLSLVMSDFQRQLPQNSTLSFEPKGKRDRDLKSASEGRNLISEKAHKELV